MAPVAGNPSGRTPPRTKAPAVSTQWRRLLGTQVPAALLGDAIARGLVVWSAQGERSPDGKWVETERGRSVR